MQKDVSYIGFFGNYVLCILRTLHYKCSYQLLVLIHLGLFHIVSLQLNWLMSSKVLHSFFWFLNCKFNSLSESARKYQT